MSDLSWVPPGIDMTKSSAARLYDYLLGGTHNFAADREMARKALAIDPHIVTVAQLNRAFLGRAVRFLIKSGIRQFVDIGSGIPTENNVHEVAQRNAPNARVVYIDHDPVAVAHSKVILTDNDKTTVIQADMRQPHRILDHPKLRDLVDLDQPTAVLLVAVLHFVVNNDEATAIVAQLRDGIAPGSYLVITHLTREGCDQDADALEKLWEHTDQPVRLRTRAEIGSLFTGLELIEPGLVYPTRWHPDSPAAPEHPAQSWLFVGVGQKPGRRAEIQARG